MGVKYAILGHSERRQKGESNEAAAVKAKAAIDNGLTVIACLGESLAEREAGKTIDVVTNQLAVRSCFCGFGAAWQEPLAADLIAIFDDGCTADVRTYDPCAWVSWPLHHVAHSPTALLLCLRVSVAGLRTLHQGLEQGGGGVRARVGDRHGQGGHPRAGAGRACQAAQLAAQQREPCSRCEHPHHLRRLRDGRLCGRPGLPARHRRLPRRWRLPQARVRGCEWKRERERERDTERGRDRDREREAAAAGAEAAANTHPSSPRISTTPASTPHPCPARPHPRRSSTRTARRPRLAPSRSASMASAASAGWCCARLRPTRCSR